MDRPTNSPEKGVAVLLLLPGVVVNVDLADAQFGQSEEFAVVGDAILIEIAPNPQFLLVVPIASSTSRFRTASTATFAKC